MEDGKKKSNAWAKQSGVNCEERGRRVGSSAKEWGKKEAKVFCVQRRWEFNKFGDFLPKFDGFGLHQISKSAILLFTDSKYLEK
jgi:hypothetical protein